MNHEKTKRQRNFEKTARNMARLLVEQYQESGDVSPVNQTYIFKDDDDYGRWYVRLAHPTLGEVEEPLR